MKSLDEAVDLFQITTESEWTESEQKQITDSIMNNHSRYRELISEAQNNPKIVRMAVAMAKVGLEMDLGIIGTVIIAISHAIAIGIEMERFDNGPTC